MEEYAIDERKEIHKQTDLLAKEVNEGNETSKCQNGTNGEKLHSLAEASQVIEVVQNAEVIIEGHVELKHDNNDLTVNSIETKDAIIESSISIVLGKTEISRKDVTENNDNISNQEIEQNLDGNSAEEPEKESSNGLREISQVHSESVSQVLESVDGNDGHRVEDASENLKPQLNYSSPSVDIVAKDSSIPMEIETDIVNHNYTIVDSSASVVQETQPVVQSPVLQTEADDTPITVTKKVLLEETDAKEKSEVDQSLENLESQLLKLTEGTLTPGTVDDITPDVSVSTDTDNEPATEGTLNSSSSIITELSVIHGERTDTVENGDGVVDNSFSEVVFEGPIKIRDKMLYFGKPKDVPLEKLLIPDDEANEAVPKDGPALNNLQLLAILEGGHDQSPGEPQTPPAKPKRGRKSTFNLSPDLEKSIALKQLKELPQGKKKKRGSLGTKIVDVKIPKVVKKSPVTKQQTPTKRQIEVQTEEIDDALLPISDNNVSSANKKPLSNDISNIIEDWSDDEGKTEESESDQTSKHKDENVSVTSDTSAIVTNAETSKDELNSESSFTEPTPKRASRIIKKKIIYDPDNPETFKFASTTIKKETPVKKDSVEKKVVTEREEMGKSEDEVPKLNSSKPKLPKNTEEMVIEQPVVEEKSTKRNSVSPSIKKKSLNTSSAKKKKLSEVDKLLMDEGAVNMIYQLERSNNNLNVPELALKPNKNSLILISKEKKALISKVKMIKRAVISQTQTNDSDKVVKVFRARRDTKANNSQEGQQKVAGLRNIMQSPSLSEMSITGTGADESRIIRRHSSSSFSSGCLSPRPQSPTIDITANISNKKYQNNSLDESLTLNSDSGIQSSTPIIRKKRNLTNATAIDVLKRKQKPSEGVRIPRQKKVKVVNKVEAVISPPPVLTTEVKTTSSYTQLSINVADNITHIVIKPTDNSEELFDLQVLTELTEAVRAAGLSDTRALLLSSSEGALCAGLDLRCLLQSSSILQRQKADQLLDAFMELMVTLCECRCALVMGVGGACAGPGVALLTLGDLVLASDRASFCVAPRPRRRLPPEGASLLTRPYALPPQIGRELVLCGRKLTASEALQRGLVARTLWPDRFLEEVRTIAIDLAQHPSQSFSIMKNVLRRGEVTAVTAALRHESRLLADYWCSSSGQEAIRDTHAHLAHL